MLGVPRALSRGLAAVAAALALAAPSAAPSAEQAPALRAGVFDPPRAAPELSLEASDGGTLTLARYRGKVVILGFGFSSCPDVCPTTLATLARARKQLGADAAEVQVVYVTVDPARDDAKRLREYLAAFDPSFVGGTGSEQALAALRKQYGIASTRKELENSYAFAHSSYTYLIDREGSLRALMPYGHSADDYVHDLRILLAR
jgi:protein SCO1/2